MHTECCLKEGKHSLSTTILYVPATPIPAFSKNNC